MKYFGLQPLRIPAGWTIKYNHFTEYDPEVDGAEYDFELNEDLLQLENGNLVIDLGWYPAMDLNGRYVLYFVDQNAGWEKPLEVFETQSKREVISKLEYWTNAGHYQQYI